MIRVWRSVRPVIKVYRGSTLQTPVLLSVSPATGGIAGGTVVTLTGYNLTGVTAVVIGGATVIPSAVTDTSVTFTTPATAAAQSVSVSVSNAIYTSNALSFAYTGSVAPAPTVTSLSVTTGPAAGGTSTTITGANFVSGATVQFGSSSFGAATFVDSSHLTVTTPAQSAGAVTVTVKNPDTQTSSLPNAFTYVAAPTVTGIIPTSGPWRATAVAIGGSGFTTSGGHLAVEMSVDSGATWVACTSVGTLGSTFVTFTTPAQTANHASSVTRFRVTNGDGQQATLGAGSYTVQCDPLDFGGRLAWWSADVGVTAPSNLVTAVTDQFGIGNDASASGSASPTLVPGGLNGKPYFAFDGVANTLTKLGVTLGGAGDLSIFLVLRAPTPNTFGGYAGYATTGLQDAAAGAGNIMVARNGSATFVGVSGIGVWARVSAVWRAAGTEEVWVAGGAGSSSALGGTLATTGGLFLSQGAGFAPFQKCDVAEVIFYNANRETDRVAIESYLTSKWGV